MISTLAATLITAQNLTSCGSAMYDPSQYTCYDGDFLCPIVNGDVYRKCGDDCYSTTGYNCIDGDFLCPIGEAKCGDACYDTNQYNCFSGELTPCIGNFGANEVCTSQGCFLLACCAGLLSIADHCRSPCDFGPC
ncbi:carbohydrate binding-domain-containing protein [Mycena polygramma]|nr:carbohydrate binding-domain-containing protein [Mycena polygramma]